MLPHDGHADYHGPVLDEQQCINYFETLFTDIQWQHDEVIMFGKRHITKRKTAWYADQPYRYRYSGTTKIALPWHPVLQQIKHTVETCCRLRFNCCLLNLYQDGSEAMSWHSDDEPELEKNGTIASLSLGAERKFSFKHKKTGQLISLVLENGSLLVMKESTQQNWLHALPKTAKVLSPRINLTFRNIVGQ